MPNPKRILVIQGHPDPAGGHYNHALAEAYARGASDAGHAVRRVELAKLDFPLLRSQADWRAGTLPPALKAAQDEITWANHLVLMFPLWLGDMPALLKGFLEQVARPGFAFKAEGGNPFAAKGLSGRSARVIVTMGMPALLYRLYFRAHSVASLERNILGFVGIAPVRRTLIGGIEAMSDAARARWLARVERLGGQGI
ncbi:MAG: NAD(P)H-dependent oxidoreductase [Burkholderiales bacterium]|nr:NAD(P)H-dependent oxidoreductase [Burkholderiales bacterium]